MYRNVSRRSGFNFLRKRFPNRVPTYRFYYATNPVIWFGGTTVPINLDGDGRATLGDHMSKHVLCSCDGGCQGCGGSTLLCIGSYSKFAIY